VRLLFAFWNRARRGKVDALYLSNGMAGREGVTAPPAVYRHSGVSSRTERLVLNHSPISIGARPFSTEVFRMPKHFGLRRLTTADIRLRFTSVQRQKPSGFHHLIQRCPLQYIKSRNGMVQ
jgi:hypothetical protein